GRARQQGQLLQEVAHRVRPAVPRDQDPGQQGEARGPGDGEGPSEDPLRAVGEAARRPGDNLRASSVSRSFEGVQALREVTLELRRREVVGLIGPNGAGKSTLVNVLSGFDRPDEGTVELEGSEITGWSPQRRARSGLARTFQHSRSFGALSVRENVEVAALGAGAGPREARRRADRVLEPLGLAKLAGKRADG